MITKLKNNIYIEGFDTKDELAITNDWIFLDVYVLYQGLTEDITEEEANKYCDVEWTASGNLMYRDYFEDIFPFNTAKESIMSACKQKYCIIY
jgi:hypothetical protein